jgi:hypothetical protein
VKVESLADRTEGPGLSFRLSTGAYWPLPCETPKYVPGCNPSCGISSGDRPRVVCDSLASIEDRDRCASSIGSRKGSYGSGCDSGDTSREEYDDRGPREAIATVAREFSAL